MSKISTIYDLLYTKLQETLTDHVELQYSNDIELNNDLAMKKGFAIHPGSGNITRRFGMCHYSIARNITITNTLANYGYDTLSASKKTSEKAVLENQIKIIEAIERDNQLSQNVMKIDFSGDGGIEYIHVDQKNYVMLKSVFNVEYEEKI